MTDHLLVDLSRLQFAMTAMYHFLFVPLTLGLGMILGIMESVYVMTGKEVYKDMSRFWGRLFAINFAMGVATGITLEFQFGTNWAYYAHYVGDIFGAPLAIEGLMAFFLESTLVGVFLFGWDRVGKVQHLAVTWLMALGASLSALWILVANGWMQHPVGSTFNPVTMRMELTSFKDVLFNITAQEKFVHTVAAGYVTGSLFVLGISAWYMLKGRDLALARRSFAVAAGFGLASALSVVVLGDESGYTIGETQKMKLAAIEGMWETEKPPAGFTLIGWPDQEQQTTRHALRIPYLLGLIATRSWDKEVIGLRELEAANAQRIRSGIVAYAALRTLRANPQDSEARATLQQHGDDLGYGLLLKRITADPATATAAQIQQAATSTIPRVWVLFFAFRIMVAIGFFQIALFALCFYYTAKKTYATKRWLLRACVLSIPLPWIAAELGWVVAEYGRQPWAIAEILPTALGVSSLSAGQVMLSLTGFVVLYTVLLVVELFLMIRSVRRGPSILGTGRYHFETTSQEVRHA